MNLLNELLSRPDAGSSVSVIDEEIAQTIHRHQAAEMQLHSLSSVIDGASNHRVRFRLFEQRMESNGKVVWKIICQMMASLINGYYDSSRVGTVFGNNVQ